MQTFNAYRRLTHSYRDGWSHLDHDEFVATVRLTPPQLVEEGNDYDEGGTFVQYVRVPRDVNAKELAQALRDTMSGSGCRHSYDCCGCASRYVTTRLVAPRRLQVRTAVSYNY